MNITKTDLSMNFTSILPTKTFKRVFCAYLMKNVEHIEDQKGEHVRWLKFHRGSEKISYKLHVL